MCLTDLSVVIPTHNRLVLLTRAVESACAAGIAEKRIIVVDDCSSDGTPQSIQARFAQLTVVPLASQGGPSRARNAGLDRVTTKYAIMLDDDDTLRQEASETLEASLRLVQDPERFPVFQFAQNNSSSDRPFFVAHLSDYVHQRLSGDFAPVIQVDAFRRLSFHYPTAVVGGESQLWFRIARATGIPTWDRPIAEVHSDAPFRLCSTRSQLQRPRDYAASIELLLDEFGADFKKLSQPYYIRKRLGAATYRLLAGDRMAALHHARLLFQEGSPVAGAKIAACMVIPNKMLRQIFAVYRKGSIA
jgi:glycosyltransferase involved in cell wall biosynthesis